MMSFKRSARSLPMLLLFFGAVCFSSLSLAGTAESFGPSSFSDRGEVVLAAWNSDEGLRRLNRSTHKVDFHQLAHRFQPQINPLYCGIATTTILLNAIKIPRGAAPSQEELEVEKPQVWGGGRIPFPSYSQVTLLNEETDEVKPRTLIDLANITEENTDDEKAFNPGLNLDQLRRIQEIYDLKAQLFYADKEPTDGVTLFRQEVKSALSDHDKFIVVNFVGTTIGTTTGGHISPLAAYDEETDSVLVLDVAGHKNPWYWSPVSHLYRAMHTKDGDSYRGWLVVQDHD